ncbi:glycerol-3-phosphate responsive antiterminator [Virgibacillus sp. 179-BFC.A HS]|uniref:Glycerol uptake operon antiterminator regulatory protein n=1 Tax=Tigheibacillus jepli TaxID=3035914 RepID=A0ABU5CJ79_9BACI|nr:glycerol-3-phosphate responsive antiterminator [Virgibacillus sp. 179-BFC.A HS]MDY0406374.1 glycerol-3-phosphate responsive antiterminator [Virgibacillus sp. 179-BFC.A HS]
MNPLKYALNKNPIIVSLTEPDDLERALATDSNIIILIQADICTLEDTVKRIKQTDKLIFVHMDLIKGLKRDASGIQFLADKIGIDGIVTTHSNLIQTAKQLGLLTIQRVFILDTASIKQGIKSIKTSQPDGVEILPGIAVPHIQKHVKPVIKQLIIAAGLINTQEEIRYILQNGAQGVSSSSLEVWLAASEM